LRAGGYHRRVAKDRSLCGFKACLAPPSAGSRMCAEHAPLFARWRKELENEPRRRVASRERVTRDCARDGCGERARPSGLCEFHEAAGRGG
jgi:hypothetical protein